MIEQSSKFLYLSVGVLLVIIALTSFFKQEAKFDQYFGELELVQKEQGWLKEDENLTSKRKLHGESSQQQGINNLLTLTETPVPFLYIYSGKELKLELLGLLLAQTKKINQWGGIPLPEHQKELFPSGDNFYNRLRIYFDDQLITSLNSESVVEGIQEEKEYRFIVEENSESYYIYSQN